MPKPRQITKAFLQEIAWNKKGKVIHEGEKVTVQFNPETLKVTLSNQIANKNNKGGGAIQFASQGTSKLTFDIWFDVTAKQPDGKTENDVRKLTKEIIKFMKVKKVTKNKKDKFIPPGARFQWGSFLFEGVMESINESLEFFSEDGRPLRASVSVSLTKQNVDIKILTINKAPDKKATGTTPKTQAKAGETFSDVMARKGDDLNKLQERAYEYGLDDTLRIPAGQRF